MRLSPLLLAFALLASPAFGQSRDPAPAPVPVPVSLNAVALITVPDSAPLVLLAEQSASAAPLKWKLSSGPKSPFSTYDQGDRKGVLLVMLKPEPGTYRFALVATGSTAGDFDFAFAEVTVGTTPRPVDPTPGPAPTPVPPTPPAPPVPSVVGNLRALVLYESSDPISPAQRNVLFSTTSVIPYLNAKCLKGSDGRAGWRFWDKDTNVANEPAEWQDAMAKAKADTTALPKIVVFAGNTVAGSRMLTSEADTLSYLQSLGGK